VETIDCMNIKLCFVYEVAFISLLEIVSMSFLI